MLKKITLTLASLSLVFFLFWSLLNSSVVKAQSNTVSVEDYQSKKIDLLKLYSQQIQAYQDVYRQYDIAVTQYQQLETLASLGELVDLSRETMKQRGEVLLTYIDILHLELRFTTNTDLQSRQDLLDSLEQLHTDFQLQQGLISNSQDYQAINARATAFTDLISRLEYVATRTKALVYTGKVENFYLESRGFFAQIEQNYQQNLGTNIKAVERQRAKDEINDAFTQIEKLWVEVDKKAQEESGSKDWYTVYLSKLTAVQNQLLLIFTYLEEGSQL